jgi:hypothetical protein
VTGAWCAGWKIDVVLPLDSGSLYGGQSGQRAAEYRQRAQAAAARARAALSRQAWVSDPGVRAQVEAILALPPTERLRQLEAEAALFADARPAVV